MGDPRRFDVFSKEIARRWPDRNIRILDAAAGKGYLYAALYQLGYRKMTAMDKRPRMAKRFYYEYRHLDLLVDCKFDLIVGMHPDEATDMIVEYAGKRRIPFAVVPCCIKPNAWTFWGQHTYPLWLDHLETKASELLLSPQRQELAMRGRNIAIYGSPALTPRPPILHNTQ